MPIAKPASGQLKVPQCRPQSCLESLGSYSDSSLVRAAAAKVLIKDPDSATTKALADAVGDKSWVVRAAALEALAERGDPSVLDTVKLYMSDDKDDVKYAAAAAVLRLSAIKESGAPFRHKKRRGRWTLRRKKSED